MSFFRKTVLEEIPTIIKIGGADLRKWADLSEYLVFDNKSARWRENPDKIQKWLPEFEKDLYYRAVFHHLESTCIDMSFLTNTDKFLVGMAMGVDQELAIALQKLGKNLDDTIRQKDITAVMSHVAAELVKLIH